MKGISLNVRIPIMAIVLILLPAAVLSYIGFLSVSERARNLETGYRGALLLVRDRIEQEILHLEQNLQSSLQNAALESSDRDSSRKLLERVESGNPWLKSPFLVHPDGEIITDLLFLEAAHPGGSALTSPSVGELFQRAEKAEFAGKDPQEARNLYTEALAASRSVHGRFVS